MAAVASKTDVFISPIGTLSPAGVRCLLGVSLTSRRTPCSAKSQCSQKQPQEASEFIRMEECGTHPYPKAPLRKGRSFRNPVLRFFHEHEILHHHPSDHYRKRRTPMAGRVSASAATFRTPSWAGDGIVFSKCAQHPSGKPQESCRRARKGHKLSEICAFAFA